MVVSADERRRECVGEGPVRAEKEGSYCRIVRAAGGVERGLRKG